jgi:hypothetical protein
MKNRSTLPVPVSVILPGCVNGNALLSVDCSISEDNSSLRKHGGAVPIQEHVRDNRSL